MVQHPGVRSRPGVRRLAAAVGTGVLVLAACGTGQRTAFPTLDTASLDASQAGLMRILQQQYDANPPGTRFSDGQDEPWCADFVTWVEHEHGTALRNPNSGGWRIPGTMTLLDELRRTGAWHPASSGYRPVTGDIAIYDAPSPFGQHTNFVLRVDGDRLTTVGGNEPGGIRLSTHSMDASLGVLGYGHPAPAR